MSKIIKNLVFDLENLSTNPEKINQRGKVSITYTFRNTILAKELVRVNKKVPGKIFLRTKFIKKHFMKFIHYYFSDDFNKNIYYSDTPIPQYEGNFFKVKNIYYKDTFIRQKTSIYEFKSPQGNLTKRDMAKIILKKLDKNVKSRKNRKKDLIFFSLNRTKNIDKKLLKTFDKILVFYLGKNEKIEERNNIHYIELSTFDLLEISRIILTISPDNDYFFAGNKKGIIPQLKLNHKEVENFINQKNYTFYFPFLLNELKGLLTPKIFERGKIKKDFYFGKYNVSLEDIIVHSRIVEDFVISKNFAFLIKNEFLYHLIPEKRHKTKKWDKFLDNIVFSIFFSFMNGCNGYFSPKSYVTFTSSERAPFFISYPFNLTKNTLKCLFKIKRLEYLALVYFGFLLNFIKSIGSKRKSLIFESGLKLTYLNILFPLLIFSLLYVREKTKKKFYKDDIPHSLIFYDIVNGKLKTKSDGEIKNVFYEIDGYPLTYIPIRSFGNINSNLLKNELLFFDHQLFLQKIVEIILEKKIFEKTIKNEKFLNFSCELIVATRDRSKDLEKLLKSLKECDLTGIKDFKITVIDSFSRSCGTKKVCEKFGVNYIRVNKPGKSYALNTGILNSSADILFFTDDDVTVEKIWVKNMLENFYDEDVACVTGFVYPQEVKSKAEHLFEGHHEEYLMGGLKRGILYEEYSYPFNPFKSAKIGTGANMAVRKKVFDEIGLFDVALSPGTPARAGEEVDLFFRILKAGKKIVYTPYVKVYHLHRDSCKKLKKMLFNYGISSGAFYTRWVIKEMKPQGLFYFLRWNILSLSIKFLKNLFFNEFYPPTLFLYELMGNLLGPLIYSYSIIKSHILYRFKNGRKKYNIDYNRCP